MGQTDPLAPVVELAAAGATGLVVALVGWLALSLALTVVAHTAALGGRAGRWADACARRIAPTAVRRALAVAVGLALSVGTTPAHATEEPSTPPDATLDLAVDLDLDLDWPDTGPAAAPAATSSTDAAPDVPDGVSEVVVRVGDSLWTIAERDLRASLATARGTARATAARGLAATTAPETAVSARQVATAWPLWWEANRDVLGDDPDLIHPGTRLTVPGH